LTSIESHTHFSEVYWIEIENGTRRLATKSSFKESFGRSIYGERILQYGLEEYRLWNPFRSKLAAVILNGLKVFPLKPGHKVLYLGAASGTTASHISDIVGKKGHLFCIEVSPRVIRSLISNVSVYRANMSPIMADGRIPEDYISLVEKVDGIYCDIAQPQQARILADNADLFLKIGGWSMLAVKARSIDVTKNSSIIYEQEKETLMNRGFHIEDLVELEPFDKAHAMIMAHK